VKRSDDDDAASTASIHYIPSTPTTTTRHRCPARCNPTRLSWIAHDAQTTDRFHRFPFASRGRIASAEKRGT